MNRVPHGVPLKQQNAGAFGIIRVFLHHHDIPRAVDDFGRGQSIRREFFIPMFGNPNLPGADQLLNLFDQRAQSSCSGGEASDGWPSTFSSNRTSNTRGQNFPVTKSRSLSGS